MSREIDDRVVRMQFDNSQFETEANRSMSTLDKLKAKLNFSGAGRGLHSAANGVSELSSAMNSLNFGGINQSIDGMGRRVTVVEALCLGAIARIGSAAYALTGRATKMVKSLSIDPVIQGFKEYETQMNAVQTILANTQSKGSTLKDVNAALDELNEYADKTIYNFTEMTRNIGTFTAAGVGLKESTQAIKGIANLAAVSGSTSEQASRAMYQLSQALAAGRVSLMDWNSVVNAGMGGEVFQEALKRTSRMMGTGVDEALAKYGTFRESLTRGMWLTKDVLTETLAEISGAYTAGELKAKGYNDQQVAEILQLSKTAEEAATKVKTFTQLMDTIKEAIGSGWSLTFRTIVGDFEQARELYTSISDYFGAIINESSEARNNMLKSWATWGGRTAGIEAIKNAFQGLVSVLRPVGQAISDIFPRPTGEQLYYLTVKLRDLTESFKITDETAEDIKNTFSGVLSVIKLFAAGVSKAASFLPGIASVLGSGARVVLKVTGAIGKLVTSIVDAVINSKTLNDIFASLHTFFDELTGSVDSFTDSIDGAIDPFTKFIDSVKESISLSGITSIFSSFGSALGQVFNKIGEILSNAFSEIGSLFRFESFAGFTNLLATGILANVGMSVKTLIDGLNENFTGNGGLIARIKDFVKNGLEPFFDTLEQYQNTLKAETIKKLAVAIAILAGALFVIAAIDSNKLSGAVTAMGFVFAELALFLWKMGTFDFKTQFKKIASVTSIMIPLSASMLLLAGALKVISTIDTGTLIASVGVLEALMLTMDLISVHMSKIEKKGGVGFGTAVNFLAMAAGIRIIAEACRELTEGTSTESLLIAASIIEVFMFTMGGMITIIGQSEASAGSAALGILAMSSSIMIIAKAMEMIANIPEAGLAKASAVVIGLSTVMTALIAVLGASEKTVGASAGLGFIGIAASLLILTKAMESIASLDDGGVLNGLAALSVLMTVMTAAAKMADGTLSGAAAIAIISAATMGLAGALKILSTIGLDGMAIALLGIAGSVGVLVSAAALAEPVIPALLALGGAFALIGIGTVGVGAGLVAISAGLASLAAMSTVAIGSTITNISMLVTGLIGLVPLIFASLANGLVSFIETLAGSATRITNALVEMLLAALDGIKQSVPALADTLLTLLVGLLEKLADNIPALVDSLMDILIGIIQGVDARIAELVDAGVNLVIDLFSAIIDAISEIGFDKITDAVLGVGAMVAFLVALGSLSGFVPAAMVGVLSLAALVVEIAAVIAALGALNQIPGLDWLISEGGELLQTIGTAIGQFIGGLVAGVAEGATSTLDAVGESLSSFMDKAKPFFDTLAAYDPAVLTAATSIFTSVIDFVTADFETNPDLVPFGNQLAEFAPLLKTFVSDISEIGDDGVAAIQNIIPAITSLAEMSSNISNSGGLVSLFTGDNDVATWGTQLASFGSSIKAYAEAVTGIAPESIAALTPAITELVTMTNSIGNSGGLVSLFTGDNDISTWGEHLKNFGEHIKNYAEAIAGINTNKMSDVRMAIYGMATLGTYINNNNYGQVISVFGDKLEDLAESVGDFADDMKDVSLDSFGNLKTAIDNLISSISDDTINQISSISDKISKLTSSLNSAIKQSKSVSTDVIDTIVNGLTTGYERFVNVGKTFAKKLIAGIEQGTAVYDASLTTGNIIEGFKKTYSSFEETGRYLAEGFSKGFNRKMDSVAQNASSRAKTILDTMNNTLGIASPSKKTALMGIFLMQGFGVGMKKAAPALGVKIKEHMTQIVLEMREASKQANAEKVGEDLASDISKGIAKKPSIKDALTKALTNAYDENWFTSFMKKSNKADIYAKQSELQAAMMSNLSTSTYGEKLSKQYEAINKKTFETSSKWIEKNTHSLIEQYGEWLKVQNRYMEGSEQRGEVDRIVSEIEEKMFIHGSAYIESQTSDIFEQINAWEELANIFQKSSEYYREAKENAEALRKETFEQSKTWIQTQIETNNRSTIKQLFDWTRLRNKFDKDTEQYKEAADNVKSLMKSIKDAASDLEKQRTDILKDSLDQRKQLEDDYADNVRSINDQLARDIENEWASYDQKLESQTNSLYKAYGLFDNVGQQTYVSKDALTERLNNQLDAFNDWTDDMDSLAKRGISDELLKELEDMGPSSANFIKALTTMTDEELDNYVDLWEEKNRLAKNRAVYELEGLEEETEDRIKELRQAADEELTDLASDLAKDLEDLNTKTIESIKTLVDDFRRDVLGEDLTKDTPFVDNLMKKITSIGDSTKWQEEGGSWAQELLDGLTNKTSGINDTLGDLSDDWLTTLNEKLGINTGSSSEFYNIGQYCLQGFIDGLTAEGSEDTEAAGETAVTSISSGMKNAFGSIVTTAKSVATNVITEIQNSGEGFLELGSSIIQSIISGIESKKSDLNKVISVILKNAVRLIKDYQSKFERAGRYLVEGFADGIDEYTFMAEARARAMARAAYEAAKEELDEHSPSKAFGRLGMFAVLGFANAIKDNTSTAEDASSGLADNVLNALKNTLLMISEFTEEALNSEPVITPVLDLSNIQNGYTELNDMLNNSYGLRLAGRIQRSNNGPLSGAINDPSKESVTNYNFTQNNYSPKALSRIDIYRQTKNQFAMMKGATSTI